MRGPIVLLTYLLNSWTVCATVRAHVGTAPGKTPQVQALPSLREQAKLLDGWTEERKALIPGLLRKYGVDAWLVRCYVISSSAARLTNLIDEPT